MILNFSAKLPLFFYSKKWSPIEDGAKNKFQAKIAPMRAVRWRKNSINQ